MITKPHEYGRSYTVSRRVNYEALDLNRKGTHCSSGTLEIGRVVWLKEALVADQPTSLANAYVDGIGVISIDLGSLSSRLNQG